MKIGDHVKIARPTRLAPGCGIDDAFEGALGCIIGKEMEMFRVRLDYPIMIEGIGRVTSDLWSREFLRITRK